MKPPEIGKLITDEVPRDAIHIAVAPVTNASDGYLQPGQPITFKTQGNVEMVEGCKWDVAVGIVDPYLRARVKHGESFWMFVKPNTITSLRHDWTHPVFDGNRKGIAEWWMRDFAEKIDVPYDVLLAGAQRGVVGAGHDWDYDMIDAHRAEFQKNVEIITGVKLTEDVRFSCAC